MKPKDNPNSPTNRLISIGVFSVLLLVTLLVASAKVHAAPTESFLLFFSNNIQGETEPCG